MAFTSNIYFMFADLGADLFLKAGKQYTAEQQKFATSLLVVGGLIEIIE